VSTYHAADTQQAVACGKDDLLGNGIRMAKLVKDLVLGGAGAATKAGDAGLLALRLSGVLMAMLHGWSKLPPSGKMITNVANMGFPVPSVFAWSAALSEFLGGILVALGLFTRPSAFFLGCTMAVAGFIAHGKDPLQRKELALVYLAIWVALALTGAGRFSIDALIRRK